jgi:hypothetical protein
MAALMLLAPPVVVGSFGASREKRQHADQQRGSRGAEIPAHERFLRRDSPAGADASHVNSRSPGFHPRDRLR